MSGKQGVDGGESAVEEREPTDVTVESNGHDGMDYCSELRWFLAAVQSKTSPRRKQI